MVMVMGMVMVEMDDGAPNGRTLWVCTHAIGKTPL